MQRRWIDIFAAATLVLAASACDRPNGAPGSDSLVAPRAATALNTSYSTPDGYTLLAGSGGESQRVVTLTSSGGRLNVGASMLTIPPGAVSEPVTFTFIVVSQPYMAGKFSAVRVRDGALITQFPVPLPLKLSYAKTVTPIPDPTKLKIYYVVDGAVQSSMPTTVDVKGQTLYTELKHFSEYSPGLDP